MNTIIIIIIISIIINYSLTLCIQPYNCVFHAHRNNYRTIEIFKNAFLPQKVSAKIRKILLDMLAFPLLLLLALSVLFIGLAQDIPLVKDGEMQFSMVEEGEDVIRQPRVDVNTTANSKYYLGGAFTYGLKGLSSNPSAWSTSAHVSGYWLHPMGFDAARQQGYAKTLLSRYGVKSYVYEADLLGWSDGTNPVQTNSPWCWGQWLEQIDPTYKQAFMAPWVAGDRIANVLQDTTNRYIDITNRMRSQGYQNVYFFYAPPSPEAISVADGLLNGRVNNVPYIQYAVQRAGLKGIAIDYPAGLYLAKEFPSSFPVGSADKCRKLAKQAWNIAQTLGIPLIWVFNGADANTRQAMDAIHAAGIYPQTFAVDDFADPNRAGVPEYDPATLSGQLRQLL
jgi:hypothetical protein